MNILIVGNGFDLSHYLPTKYDHFMDVMKAIEEKVLDENISKIFKKPIQPLESVIKKCSGSRKTVDKFFYDMNFTQLIELCRDKKFIQKTLEIYKTDDIALHFEDIIIFKYKLLNNCWYQYFKAHLKDIDTWIDFEQKIEELLKYFGSISIDIEQCKSESEIKRYLESSNGIYFINKLNDFRISILVEKDDKELDENETSNPLSYEALLIKEPSTICLNPNFCYGNTIDNGFNSSSFSKHLYQQLENFIEIFNLYLVIIIKKLQPKSHFVIEHTDWNQPNKIYSFNYTNTYQQIYGEIPTEYLHGKSGDKQNIVLGVSDIDDEVLTRIKAYGFTKYQQKLFKDTDYRFLDEETRKVESHKRRIEYFEKEIGGNIQERRLERMEIMEEGGKLNLNFYIWGHSLDESDKEYILDLFSLNDDMDRNVRVVVYYFDSNAKFSLLNNLLHILEKKKVEQWMKNKWLIFEENPKIDFGV